MLTPHTQAPLFSLKDADGNLVELKSFLGKKIVVLFFYPKDETPGCTAQACSFRDNYVGFKAHNAQVLGISSDSEESHQDFKNKHKLPYPLLSDPAGEVAARYGVKKRFGFLKDRVSFVIDQTGMIKHAYSSQLQVHNHIDECLRAVQQINSANMTTPNNPISVE
ncbi:MAG: peroxiredoxin [Myxococcaceae bacterium]